MTGKTATAIEGAAVLGCGGESAEGTVEPAGVLALEEGEVADAGPEDGEEAVPVTLTASFMPAEQWLGKVQM